MRELARGAHDVGKGLAAIRRFPETWKWLAMPAVLSLAILVGVIAAIVHLVTPLVASVESHLPSFIASLAGTVLAIVVVAALATGGLLIYGTVAGAIAGPFNERLSELLEARLQGTVVPPFVVRQFLHEASVGAVHAIRRVIAAIAGSLLVVGLGFIPGIGTIAALVLGTWFAARAATYNCYDAVLARRHLSYRDKVAYLGKARPLGLGAAIAGMLLVPGLNLVALGIGSAGATVALQSSSTTRRDLPSRSKISVAP